MQRITTGSELKDFLSNEGITVAEGAKRLSVSERIMYDYFKQPTLPAAIMRKIEMGDLIREPADPNAPFALPPTLNLNLPETRRGFITELLNRELRTRTEINHIFIVDAKEGEIIFNDSHVKPEILEGSRHKYVDDRSLFDFVWANSSTMSILVSNEDSRVVLHKMDQQGEYFLVVRTESHDHYRFSAVEAFSQNLIKEIGRIVPKKNHEPAATAT